MTWHMAFSFLSALLIFPGSAVYELQDATALLQEYRSQNPDDTVVPQKQRAEVEVEVAENSGAGVVTSHYGGTEVVSGAFGFDIAREMMRAGFEDATREFAKVSASELERFERSNSSFYSEGIQMTKEINSVDGSGNVLVSQVEGDFCKTANEFGSADCTIKWGDKIHTKGGVLVKEELPAGTKVFMNFIFKLQSELLPGLAPGTQFSKTCEICGSSCSVKLGKREFDVTAGPCPVKPGFYDFWVETFPLPDSFLIRSLQFEQDIEMVLTHPDGHEMYNGLMKVVTFSKGTGGGWRAAEPVGEPLEKAAEQIAETAEEPVA